MRIPDEYLKNDAFDFGFTTEDGEETGGRFDELQDKLDTILSLHSTCEGAQAVREQYEKIMSAKLLEVEKLILPLLVSLAKNPEKDFLKWPGKEREAKCQLQIERILGVTRGIS